jgi:hypothetical protein
MKLDVLFERSMSAKTLTSGIDQSNAHVGFEFEVVVPENSPFFQAHGDDEPPASIDLDSDDYYIIAEYFTLSRAEHQKLEREFDYWVEDRRAEHKGDPDEFEQPDENAWINDAYGSVFELVKKHRLDPKFGFTDASHHEVYKVEANLDQHHAFWETAKSVGFALGDKLGVYFKLDDHGIKDWKIVEDSSIKPEDKRGVGLEIVTAPLPAKEAIATMRTCFAFFSKAKFQTNSSTGVHVNISIPNLNQLDPLKLVLFMGEEHALKQFNRLFSNVAVPHAKRLIKAIGTGAGARDVKVVMDEAREILKQSGKYSSVNLSKLADGYLEFRVAGGADYHHEEELLLEQLGRWLEALKIATTPELYRNEYLKKVTKLIAKAGIPLEDALALKAQAAAKKT